MEGLTETIFQIVADAPRVSFEVSAGGDGKHVVFFFVSAAVAPADGGGVCETGDGEPALQVGGLGADAAGLAPLERLDGRRSLGTRRRGL